MSSSSKINLACGSVFVDSKDWINLDFVSVSPNVRRANLLGRLPLPSNQASCVYSSHFLEHIPRRNVDSFLGECFRVLKPGGVVRLVLPDLEEMARTYLTLREAGKHDRADFLVMEMVDQCVRRESGGELGSLYRRIRPNAEEHTDMVEFIRQRNGENLADSKRIQNVWGGGRIMRAFRAIPNRMQHYWIRLCLLLLPAAFRVQNVSHAAVGEKHHWLWDFHQLRNALQNAGFVDVERKSAQTSAIGGFPFAVLDLDADGLPRKGAESMYVEARKPD